MDNQLLKAYLQSYKENFPKISRQEIYKWQAIKQFQDNFDLSSQNFHDNLELALKKSNNLLDSKNYLPKQMLLRVAEAYPEQVRVLLNKLYDEDEYVLQRIKNFRASFRELTKGLNPDYNDYQDDRAIIVYLALNYPDDYFFYKFGMFHVFGQKVRYSYVPIRGRAENIGQYNSLCEHVRGLLMQDQELISLHGSRLENASGCYRDTKYTVLTQDFIYAVVEHLNEIGNKTQYIPHALSEGEVKATDLVSSSHKTDLSPKTFNHAKKNAESKRVGDLGEHWVVEYERKKLKDCGKENLAKKVTHDSKEKGDGLGYDVLSRSLDGRPKYIEVKTTKGKATMPFFITWNELQCSIKFKDDFYLYRVYDYNEDTGEASLLVIQGDMSSLCINPQNFQVLLELNGNA